MELTKNCLRMNKCTSAFALMLVLILISFLMVLLTTFFSQVTSSSQESRANLDHLKSELYAKFSLHVALGQLQMAAGPDTVVTANNNFSDGNVNTPGSEKWLGVWSSVEPLNVVNNPQSFSDQYFNYTAKRNNSLNNNGSFIRWLVSGESSLVNNYKTTLSSESIFLLEDIPVSKIELKNLDNSINNSGIAFYISDESLKAKLSTKPNNNSVYDLMSPVGAAPELIDSKLSNFANALKNRLLLTEETIQLISNNKNVLTEWKNIEKSFSPYSRGLFTNVRKGGLRKDLNAYFNSTSPNLPSELPAYSLTLGTNDRMLNLPTSTKRLPLKSPTWEYLKSFYNFKGDAPYQLINPKSDNEFVPHPVIVGCTLTTKPIRVGNKLRIYLEPQLLLWNPNNITIAPSNYEFEFMFLGGGPRWVPEFISSSGTVKYMVNSAGVENLVNNGAIFNYINYTSGSNVPARLIRSSDFNTSSSGFKFPLNVGRMNPGDVTLLSLDWQGSDPINLTDDPTDSGFRYTGNNTMSTGLPIEGSVCYIEHTQFIPAGVESDNFRLSLVGVAMGIGRISIKPTDFTNDPLVVANEPISNFYQMGFANATYPTTNNSSGPLVDLLTLAPGDRSDALFLSNSQVFTTTLTISDSSTGGIQWLRNSNLRATAMQQVARESKISGLWTTGKMTAGATRFDTDADGLGFFGNGHFPSISGNSSNNRMSFFDLPESNRKPLGIANFQHLPFSDSMASQTSPIGNSLIEARLYNKNTIYRLGAVSGREDYSDFIDWSYWLNNTLWDDYFLSGIDSAGISRNLSFSSSTQNPIANEYASLANKFSDAGTVIMNDNVFNINSMDTTAWAAFLGSTINNTYKPETQQSSNPTGVIHPRSFKTLQGPGNIWNGYPVLSASQIASLSKAIVNEIQTSGPYYSIADFVNRRPAISETKSPLERAIRAAGLNLSIYNNSNLIPKLGDVLYQKDVIEGESLSEAIPGWITQADLLQTMGNSITARSDTFKIYFYGEHNTGLNQSSSSKKGVALVQRYPDYIDSSNTPAEGIYQFFQFNQSFALNPNFSFLNQRFGRKFKLISIKWLD